MCVAQVALGVLENYLLLAGRELLEAHAPKVVEMLTSLLDALNERGTLLVFPVLDTMLQLFPQEAPALLEPPLHRALGLIVGGKHSDMVVASAACVLARVLLQNNAAFGQIMVREEDSGRGALALLFSRGRRHPDSTAPLPPRVCCRSVRLYRRMCIASVRRLSAASFCSRRPAQASAAAVPELAAAAGAEGVLDRFLDAWLDKSDALCTPKARKVTALALCTLLSMGAPQVRELGTPPPPLLSETCHSSPPVSIVVSIVPSHSVSSVWVRTGRRPAARHKVNKVHTNGAFVVVVLCWRQVLQRLDLVASLCTSVVYEADDEEADGASVPSPGWAAHLAAAGSRPSALSTSVDTDAPEGSGKDLRRQQLERADPVNVLVLRTVLAESMAKGPAVYGAAPFQAAVTSLDATILKHLHECTQPVAASPST